MPQEEMRIPKVEKESEPMEEYASMSGEFPLEGIVNVSLVLVAFLILGRRRSLS